MVGVPPLVAHYWADVQPVQSIYAWIIYRGFYSHKNVQPTFAMRNKVVVLICLRHCNDCFCSCWMVAGEW